MTSNKQKEIARQSAKILLDTNAALINIKEPFTYTSGRKGPIYADCRRLISFVKERATLMDMAVEMLEENIGVETLDYIAGGETAGIPYAAFIAERMQKPMLYVRKKPKGFGRMAQIEGYMQEENPRILLTEDVLNFGTSLKIFIPALREAGTIAEDLFVLFSHNHESVRKDMKEMGVTLHALATWTDILDVARQEAYFDNETLESVESYLKDPDGWAEAST